MTAVPPVCYTETNLTAAGGNFETPFHLFIVFQMATAHRATLPSGASGSGPNTRH